MDQENETLDLFCEDCGVQVEAQVLATHTVTDPGQVVSDELDPVKLTTYSMAVCKRCQSPFLTRQAFMDTPEADVVAPRGDAVVLYPVLGRGIPSGVPARVAKAYSEAVVAFRAGLLDACAIMCRKAIEALCHELGATGGTLLKKLEVLEKGEVIEAKLVKWADGLRVVGNDAAHDLDISISRQDAEDALEFAEAILSYVFSLTRRFDAFQKRRKKRLEPV